MRSDYHRSMGKCVFYMDPTPPTYRIFFLRAHPIETPYAYTRCSERPARGLIRQVSGPISVGRFYMMGANIDFSRTKKRSNAKEKNLA